MRSASRAVVAIALLAAVSWLTAPSSQANGQKPAGSPAPLGHSAGGAAHDPSAAGAARDPSAAGAARDHQHGDGHGDHQHGHGHGDHQHEPGHGDGAHMHAPVPAEYQGAHVPAFVWTDARMLARGREIYAARCAVCHGDDGDGKGPAGVALPLKPPDLRDVKMVGEMAGNYWFWRVSEGGLVEPFKSAGSAMPAWKDELSVEDRWAVIAYQHTYSGHRGPHVTSEHPELAPAMTAGAPPPGAAPPAGSGPPVARPPAGSPPTTGAGGHKH